MLRKKTQDVSCIILETVKCFIPDATIQGRLKSDVYYSPEQLLGTTLANLLFSETHYMNADTMHNIIPILYILKT